MHFNAVRCAFFPLRNFHFLFIFFRMKGSGREENYFSKCTRNKNYFIDNKCTQICCISHMENCEWLAYLHPHRINNDDE